MKKASILNLFSARMSFQVIATLLVSCVGFCFTAPATAQSTDDAKAVEPKIKVLIVEGQNNHRNWPKTSQMMKGFLEDCGKFQVDIARSKAKGVDAEFHPKFSDYDVVLSNYNGAPWPKETQVAFESFVKNGGGFVVIHAADNSFPKWKAYNQMIGLGGWGGRNQQSGPYVYYNSKGEKVVDPKKGRGGSHGRQHPFQVIARNQKHPITKGLPQVWWHEKDELYDSLRGPAENLTVLATAYSDKRTGGSGRHEPMVMVLDYGKGRVFHCPMGHSNESHRCVGFVTLLRRGTQWAATGKVSIPVPKEFPTEKVLLLPDPTSK